MRAGAVSGMGSRAPTSFWAGSTPSGRSSAAWCISCSRGRPPLIMGRAQLVQVLVLLLLPLGPSSSPFSELSWDPCRPKGPVLPWLDHLDSRKLWTSCPERGLRLGKTGYRLPREGHTKCTGPLSPNVSPCHLPGPGPFPAPLLIWTMPTGYRPLGVPNTHCYYLGDGRCRSQAALHHLLIRLLVLVARIRAAVRQESTPGTWGRGLRTRPVLHDPHGESPGRAMPLFSLPRAGPSAPD